MEIRVLRYFLEIAREGNMSRAAERLHVTQPTLSKQMKNLEQELGKRIFKRGRNAQSYTKAKNASMADYRIATGFEALMGYLYLSGQSERMMELIGVGLTMPDEEK